MRFKANAKINLALDVLGKRTDGYHEVSMIMQEIDFGDIIDIELMQDEGIELSVEGADLPCDEGNIAYRAAKLFYSVSSLGGGCRIKLTKKIPCCAGLGGGSSDAACILNALNQMHSYPIDKKALLDMATKLGADVPFCLVGGSAHAGGIGEILSPFKSALDMWVCFIKPDIDISTPKAYKMVDNAPKPFIDINAAIAALEKGRLDDFKLNTGNVFDNVMSAIYPEIDIIKNHLIKNGASFAMMSGSGPTVYGLFSEEEAALRALSTYKGSYQAGGVGIFRR